MPAPDSKTDYNVDEGLTLALQNFERQDEDNLLIRYAKAGSFLDRVALLFYGVEIPVEAQRAAIELIGDRSSFLRFKEIDALLTGVRRRAAPEIVTAVLKVLSSTHDRFLLDLGIRWSSSALTRRSGRNPSQSAIVKNVVSSFVKENDYENLSNFSQELALIGFIVDLHTTKACSSEELLRYVSGGAFSRVGLAGQEMAHWQLALNFYSPRKDGDEVAALIDNPKLVPNETWLGMCEYASLSPRKKAWLKEGAVLLAATADVARIELYKLLSTDITADWQARAYRTKVLELSLDQVGELLSEKTDPISLTERFRNFRVRNNNASESLQNNELAELKLHVGPLEVPIPNRPNIQHPSFIKLCNDIELIRKLIIENQHDNSKLNSTLWDNFENLSILPKFWVAQFIGNRFSQAEQHDFLEGIKSTLNRDYVEYSAAITRLQNVVEKIKYPQLLSSYAHNPDLLEAHRSLGSGLNSTVDTDFTTAVLQGPMVPNGSGHWSTLWLMSVACDFSGRIRSILNEVIKIPAQAISLRQSEEIISIANCNKDIDMLFDAYWKFYNEGSEFKQQTVRLLAESNLTTFKTGAILKNLKVMSEAEIEILSKELSGQALLTNILDYKAVFQSAPNKSRAKEGAIQLIEKCKAARTKSLLSYALGWIPSEIVDDRVRQILRFSEGKAGELAYDFVRYSRRAGFQELVDNDQLFRQYLELFNKPRKERLQVLNALPKQASANTYAVVSGMLSETAVERNLGPDLKVTMQKQAREFAEIDFKPQRIIIIGGEFEPEARARLQAFESRVPISILDQKSNPPKNKKFREGDLALFVTGSLTHSEFYRLRDEAKNGHAVSYYVPSRGTRRLASIIERFLKN